MQGEARMAQQPALDRGSLAGRGVLEHDVDVEVGRHRALDQVEEAAEVLGAVTGGHLGDHLAAGEVEGGVEVRVPLRT